MCLVLHSLQAGQLRVARSANGVVPPLPLTLGTVKEKQAFERELHTVTVGEHCFWTCKALPLHNCLQEKASCKSEKCVCFGAAIIANMVIFSAKLVTYLMSGSR